MTKGVSLGANKQGSKKGTGVDMEEAAGGNMKDTSKETDEDEHKTVKKCVVCGSPHSFMRFRAVTLRLMLLPE